MDMARKIAESAIRLDNDVNGNPRYYIPCFMFWDTLGYGVKPMGFSKYRGKRYGPGYATTSYNLENDIKGVLKYTLI